MNDAPNSCAHYRLYARRLQIESGFDAPPSGLYEEFEGAIPISCLLEPEVYAHYAISQLNQRFHGWKIREVTLIIMPNPTPVTP
jgi:hypothetical protein